MGKCAYSWKSQRILGGKPYKSAPNALLVIQQQMAFAPCAEKMVFAIFICNETYSKHETPELSNKFYKEVSGVILENAGNQDPSDDDTKNMVERVKMFFQINEGLIWRTQLSDGKTRGVSKTDAMNKLTAPVSEKLTKEGVKKRAKKAA